MTTTEPDLLQQIDALAVTTIFSRDDLRRAIATLDRYRAQEFLPPRSRAHIARLLPSVTQIAAALGKPCWYVLLQSDAVCGYG